MPEARQRGAAAKKPKTRKLWGDGKGTFRTTGKYSAATVRGTKWLVQDSCAGTLTRVTQGVGQPCPSTVKRIRYVVRAGQSLHRSRQVDDDLADRAALDRVVRGAGLREREAVQRQRGQRARVDRLRDAADRGLQRRACGIV